MNYLHTETQDAVLIITMDRPKALNALNSQVLDELDQTLNEVDLEHIRCLVITGAGTKAFAAGADIGEMADLDEEGAKAFSTKGNNVFLRIEQFPVPVIAAVNGYALGGGNELAMACDIRFASENAVFGQPETGLGITPGFGGTQRLARLVGKGKASEIIFTAGSIKAEEAYQIGLVNAVYPSEQLMDKTLQCARRIAAQAPIAVRQAKAAIREGEGWSIDQAVQIEERRFAECFNSQDQKDGMKAFLEHRKEKVFHNQ